MAAWLLKLQRSLDKGAPIKLATLDICFDRVEVCIGCSTPLRLVEFSCLGLLSSIFVDRFSNAGLASFANTIQGDMAIAPE